MRYFIQLSYNGKDFHGWQNQPNAITVQAVIEDALTKLLRTPIEVIGAGRTDAGVHAKIMIAHFDTDQELKDNLVFKLNSFLPKSIAVQTINAVKSDAHARFDAISRSYIYRVSMEKDVFNFEQSYYFKNTLNVDEMNRASKILFEYKDFQCFSRTNTDVRTYNCKIMHAQWKITENELIFEISADRFLRNMVRAIVGTMLDIGVGKMKVEMLHDVIASKNRANAGASVPAHGLYLTDIKYHNAVYLNE
ncbi:MAG: tRNA pseudouridine(38-40) synthase TruA [Flavobacteriaceae bacterium]|nr:tRNA pseudouridine(38-40) synthase TruA [Flavobacteriaceae bacterium]